MAVRSYGRLGSLLVRGQRAAELAAGLGIRPANTLRNALSVLPERRNLVPGEGDSGVGRGERPSSWPPKDRVQHRCLNRSLIVHVSVYVIVDNPSCQANTPHHPCKTDVAHGRRSPTFPSTGTLASGACRVATSQRRGSGHACCRTPAQCALCRTVKGPTAIVRGHGKVPTGGQVAVPAGGHVEVPASCSSCRAGA